MGSQSYKQTSYGTSLKEAYNIAVRNADEEYGHQQGYSGEINNSHGLIDVTTNFKNSRENLNVFIEKMLNQTGKHDPCMAICISEPKPNTNKIKTQVEHIVKSGKKKWELKYVIYGYEGPLLSFATKGEAVAAARVYTEKSKNTSYIRIEKILPKGEASLAIITYKKSPNEKSGEWILFGWASN